MKIRVLLSIHLVIAANSCWASRRSAQQACLTDNGLDISNSTDLNRMTRLLDRNARPTVRDVAFEEKFACAIVCEFHVAKERGVTINGILETAIDTDEQLDEAQKDEMKNKLSACNATADKDDDCTLLKCLNIFQPPFVQILLQRPELLF